MLTLLTLTCVHVHVNGGEGYCNCFMYVLANSGLHELWQGSCTPGKNFWQINNSFGILNKLLVDFKLYKDKKNKRLLVTLGM